MPVILGSNIASLSAQRQLSNASSALSQVFERLSSGQRINRASDDAAGLAIADSLNADQRVYTQGIRNLNDGLSILNVADGALGELTNITVRLMELAEQSSNGVFSNQQRSALDNEAQALSDEFLRIVQSTKFNGRHILSGDYGILNLQAGYGDDGRLGNGLGGAIGTGTFEDVNLQTLTGLNFQEAATGDINGDGNVDIVAVAGTSDIQIFLGNGSGSFTSPNTVTSSIAPSEVALSDFNGDGIYDIVEADSNATLRVQLGNGDGTFSQSHSSVGVYENITDLVTGDINGDGIADIITSGVSSYQKRIHIRLGNGDGTFQTPTNILQDTNANESGGLDLGDVNGDGLLDILSTRTTDDFSEGVINVYLNSGSGTFTASATQTISSIQAGDAIFSDFNQDGNLDIAAASGADVQIFLGDGTGSFSINATYTPGTVQNLAAADINGDGIVDIVVGQASSYSTLLGKNDGTFEPPQSFGPYTGMGSGGIYLADTTNDGVLDLIGIGSTRLATANGETVDGVAPLLEFSLRTALEAKEALSQFSHKLNHITTQRGQIGAFQSRVLVASNVLQASTENYAAAESRIRDADIAQESSQLTRLNILQQAGAAVLAQANLQPQIALKLLSR